MPLFNDADFNFLLSNPSIKKNSEAKIALQNPKVRRLMMGEAPILSVEDLTRLTPLLRKILENDMVNDFLSKKWISLAGAFKIRNEKILKYVTQPDILSLAFQYRMYTLAEIFSLKELQAKALSRPKIRALLTGTAPLLSKEKLATFSEVAINAFENDEIVALIREGTLPINKILKIRHATYKVLVDPAARALFFNDVSPLNQTHKKSLFTLNDGLAAILINPDARACIAELNPTNPLLTIKQVFTLEYQSALAFNEATIRELLRQRFLTITHLKKFTYNQLDALRKAGVRRLLRRGLLTINDLKDISYEHRQALSDNDTVERLLDGRLTLEHVFNTQPPIDRDPIFNTQQSTHTASVHQSTADAIVTLQKEYGKNIQTPNDKESVIARLKCWLQALPPSPHVNSALKQQAALNCLERFKKYQIEKRSPLEAKTKIDFFGFLALAWLAIEDDAVRVGNKQDAENQVLNALYEIQRGYNLDERGLDDEKPLDAPICMAGSFNKLCEKLVGIHPRIILRVVSKEGASAKLPYFIKQATEDHISNKVMPVDRLALIEKLASEGPVSIWPHIQSAVFEAVFEEFSEAYGKNRKHKELLALVKCGVELGFDEAWITQLKKKYTQKYTVQALETAFKNPTLEEKSMSDTLVSGLPEAHLLREFPDQKAIRLPSKNEKKFPLTQDTHPFVLFQPQGQHINGKRTFETLNKNPIVEEQDKNADRQGAHDNNEFDAIRKLKKR